MDLEVLVGVVVGGLLVLWLFGRRATGKSVVRSIPGLSSVSPDVGNLGELAECGTFQRFLTKYHHRFGSIFSFWYGKLYAVSLSDPEYVKCVGHLLAHHPVQTQAIEVFLNTKAMASVTGVEWKRRRHQYWDQAFSPKAVAQRQSQLEALLSSTYLPSWDLLAASNSPMDACSHFLRMSIRVIYEYALGDCIDDREIDRIFHPTKDMWSLLEKQIHGTASQLEAETFEKSCGKIREICEEIIALRRSTVRTETSFIDFVLKDTDPRVVYADVASALLGGIHATSTLLVWSVYYLARYPEQQQKIWTEVSGAQRGVVTTEVAQSSQALSQFVDEVLRVSLLTTFVQRVNDGPAISLPGGFQIPTGALVYLNQETMLWSSEYYRNPCEFNPARFNNPEARSQNQFFPFSFLGGRSCPGKWLALQEVSLCLSTLILNFHLSLHPTQVFPVEATASFFNNPKQDVFISLKKRDLR